MFKKRYLALDIGNRNIKIVYGGASKKKIEIIEYDIVDTPANSIKDGKIINTKALANTVAEVLKKNHIKAKKLILNITGTGVITRDVLLPRSTDEEIEKILEFEAQQYFPVNLENYVLDFKILEEVSNSEGVYNRVLLVAVPLKQVEEYMKIPGLLKMELVAIDIPANCISKFLFIEDKLIIEAGLANEAGVNKNENENSDTPKEFAVIDIGSETTGVCIFHGTKLKFNRILLNGSGDIDRLISNEFDIDFKQAEEIKIRKSKIVSEDDDIDTPDGEINISDVIKPSINNLISDISRFFDFYNSRSVGNRLQRIYICGGGSKLKGLDKYISSYFNIPVEYLSISGNVVYNGKAKVFKDDFAYLASAIGALVR